MLIISADAAYYLPLNPQGPPAIMPQAVLTAQPLRFALEGRRHRVFLLPENELLITQGATSTRVATGIAEPITSLAILNEQPLTLVLGVEPAAHLSPDAGRRRGARQHVL